MKYCGTYTLKSEPGATCLAFDESVLGRDKYPDSEGISSVIAKFEMAKNIHLEMCFLIPSSNVWPSFFNI